MCLKSSFSAFLIFERLFISNSPILDYRHLWFFLFCLWFWYLKVQNYFSENLEISRCCDIRHLSFRLCSRISLFLKTAIPTILCPWAKIQNGLSKNSWRNWARQSPLSLIFEGISLWLYLPSLNFMPLIFSFVEDAVITQNLSYGDLTCKEHYFIMLWQGKLD